ncbi:hypothetical protein DXG03_005325 [Asterophora parasitica]|uniref:Uncharacterized protein n=1 Tax=Asterophora parasitica TaxID=117018 RepID=A0A9P7G950_9AGAR|nr:hypothetical protein DXG03_005325 [Asterophora parasitica]
MSEIPRYIGASRCAHAEEAVTVKEKEYEARELARQSMIIVDGWQTYATSSPSTVSSFSDEDEIDELIGMFPSSPDTSILGSGGNLETLTRDVEESKLDEILVPRDRRIGGVTAGKGKRIVDRARKAGGLGPFLAPLLGVVGPTPASVTNDNEIGVADLHPLLNGKLALIKSTSSEDIAKEKADTSNGDYKNADANERADMGLDDSMLGQPSAFSSIPLEFKPQREDSENDEIRALYQDLSQLLPAEEAAQKRLVVPRLGPALPRTTPDPRAPIRDEKLFDDHDEDKKEARKDGKKEMARRLLPITVPLLCAPNVDAQPRLKGFRELLPIQPGAGVVLMDAEAPLKITKPQQPMRFLKCVKGIASLRVALSWVYVFPIANVAYNLPIFDNSPFTRTNPIPAHTHIIKADLFHSPKEATNSDTLRNDVHALLARLGLGPAEDKGVYPRDASTGCECDEARWRGARGGLSGVAGAEDTAAFVPEIEIILTRAERGALNAREGRVSLQDDSENFGAAGVETNAGSAHNEGDVEEHIRHTSADKRTSPCPENVDRYEDGRPAKRPRLALDVNDDSGIGMLQASADEGRRLLGFPQNGLVLDEGEYLEDQLEDVLDSIDDNDSFAPDFASRNPCFNADEENSDVFTLGDFDVGPDLMTAFAYDDGQRYYDDQEKMDFGTGHDDGPRSFEPLSLSYDSQAYPPLHSQVCGPPDLQELSQDPSISCWTRLRPVLGDIAPDGGRQIARATFPTELDEDDTDISDPDVFGRKTMYTEHSADDAMTASAMPVKKLNDLATHALGIEAFAMLRARKIASSTVPQASSVSAPVAHPPASTSVERSGPRIVPPEVYDRKTLRLGSSWTMPATIHRYMASLDLLQKQVLVRSLASPECLVELIERDALEGVDLIVDPHTAVIFTSLLSLPAHNKKLLATLSEQTWRYKRLLVVFEAYPASRSFKASTRMQQKQGHESVEPELWAYTPPILKALKRFRRDLDIAEGCGKKAAGCEVWYAFADCVQNAAAYARWFGNEAEEVDCTDGAIWGDREWLDLEISEDEGHLALLGGMNRFSASIILCQMDLQQFIDLDPAARLATVGPFIGREAIDMFNLDIERRIQDTEALELETHQSNDDVDVDVSEEHASNHRLHNLCDLE